MGVRHITESRVTWPDGKGFAFTIFDDTDHQTLANVPPVYDFLHELGFRTTKSVWPIDWTERPLRPEEEPLKPISMPFGESIGGTTCEDPGYLAWVKALQSRGFEIALHNVTFQTSHREDTIRGIERFNEQFGHYPRVHANHFGCYEGIYWGNHRLTGMNELLYNVLNRFKTRDAFRGHLENSSLFWGDICKEKIAYVRNFAFGDINTLKACPYMPYHDSARPYVNHWFASSEGPDVNSFVTTVSEANLDRLEAEGGACIMYTHLAFGFYEQGRLHPRFKQLMERLSRKNGWFVPVSTLLDHLLQVKGSIEITKRERAQLERRWLLHKIRVGGSS